jgi:hypothetical protein
VQHEAMMRAVELVAQLARDTATLRQNRLCSAHQRGRDLRVIAHKMRIAKKFAERGDAAQADCWP